MTGWKARSLVSACAAGVVSALAFIGPSTAMAAPCPGANIKGNGSSLQANAQQKFWSPVFNAKCGEGGEQVEYIKTSSGEGLESWFVGENKADYKGMGAENAFVGTDQPPSEKFETEILKNAPGAKVLSIPVLQAAVALPIHLPKGCLATALKKTKLIHRLILSDLQLEEIFARKLKKWSEVVPVEKTLNPFEDKLVNDGTETCNAEEEITRVVRKEGSGTSAIFKKFLYEINKEPVDGTENWNNLAEGIENTPWPEEAEKLLREKKGSGIASGVASTSGSIGYANLNEVRENLAFVSGENAKKEAGTGGEEKPTFWPELQSKGKKFQEPGTNSDIATPALANCAAETYVSLNGTGKTAKYPPSSTEVPWNEVTASTSQKASYPLCGFTYDLSLTKYSANSETTPAEVETVKDYFEFILNKGQEIINEDHDFLALPEGKKLGNVLKIAREGAAKIAD